MKRLVYDLSMFHIWLSFCICNIKRGRPESLSQFILQNDYSLDHQTVNGITFWIPRSEHLIEEAETVSMATNLTWEETLQHDVSHVLETYITPPVFVLGILGNILALVVFSQKELRGTLNSRFYRLLAVVDTLTLLLYDGTHVIPLLFDTSLLTLNTTTCKVGTMTSHGPCITIAMSRRRKTVSQWEHSFHESCAAIGWKDCDSIRSPSSCITRLLWGKLPVTVRLSRQS